MGCLVAEQCNNKQGQSIQMYALMNVWLKGWSWGSKMCHIKKKIKKKEKERNYCPTVFLWNCDNYPRDNLPQVFSWSWDSVRWLKNWEEFEGVEFQLHIQGNHNGNPHRSNFLICWQGLLGNRDGWSGFRLTHKFFWNCIGVIIII